MAETPTPAAKKPVQQKPASKFRQAVDWAIDRSLEAHAGSCGICAWEPWSQGSKAQTRASLGQHIRSVHKHSIVELFDHQVLNLSELEPQAEAPQTDNELLAVAGLSEIQQLTRFDRLAIPEKIRKEAELDGAEFRFVRAERVDHFKAQGATIVHLNGESGVAQPSSEDGILRAREMVCVKIPHEVVLRRRQEKESMLNKALHARAEEIMIHRDEFEKKTYDYLRQYRKLDHEKAARITSALMRRRGGDDDAASSNLGMTVTDRHGTQTF